MKLLSHGTIRISRCAFYGLWPLFGLALLGSMAALWSYGVILAPSQERLDAIQTSYEQARRDHSKRVSDKQVQQRVLQGRRELDRLWKTLPTQNQFAALAVAISELGKSVNVSIPGMTYSVKPATNGLPGEGALRFRAVGEYADIYRFIHQIETAKSYLIIESLDVTRTTAHRITGRPPIEVNIRVVTFLQPDSATQGES